MAQLTREEIITRITQETGLTRQDVKTTIASLFQNVTKAISDGDDVSFVGFANFKVVERAARQGRNPATGEEMSIPAGKGLKIEPSSKLKQAAKESGSK